MANRPRATAPVPSAHVCEASGGVAVTVDQSAPVRGRRSTRAMLAKAAEAEAGAAKLAAIVEAARAEVVAAFEAARERQVWAAIEKMSIEAIKDVDRRPGAAERAAGARLLHRRRRPARPGRTG